jgi:DNA-binding NtrC family response regulator
MEFKILIVDDDRILCKNLKEHLISKGYIPICAYSGMEAIGVIKESDFHLVLTDLQMPYIDGFGLLKFIKQTKAELPVILMTGDDDSTVKDKAFELGVSEFIKKPFNMEYMMRTIDNVLKER